VHGFAGQCDSTLFNGFAANQREMATPQINDLAAPCKLELRPQVQALAGLMLRTIRNDEGHFQGLELTPIRGAAR
jgi:hypothetical protein